MDDLFDTPKTAIDLLPAQVAILNEQGVIQYTNKAWEDFAQDNGYVGPAFSGQNYLDVCVDTNGVETQQADAFVDGLRGVLSGQHKRFELTYPCHSPAVPRWFKGIAYKPGRTITIMHVNITEEYQRLERLSDFLGNAQMVHELRTPLNAIMGFADFSRLLGADKIDQIHEHLDIIHSSGQRMLGLVNTLLLSARGELGNATNSDKIIDLGTLINDIVREHASLSTKADVTVDLDIVKNVNFIGNEEALWKVFANLVSNAVKYNTSGGRVQIKAFLNASRGLVVCVTDTGVGIDADHLDKVFDPFYRVDHMEENRDGTGLGLAIARDEVKSHGGDLQVESAMGEGSTFTVRLPGWRTIQTGEESS